VLHSREIGGEARHQVAAFGAFEEVERERLQVLELGLPDRAHHRRSEPRVQEISPDHRTGGDDHARDQRDQSPREQPSIGGFDRAIDQELEAEREDVAKISSMMRPSSRSRSTRPRTSRRSSRPSTPS
jgi:hypothetical protein